MRDLSGKTLTADLSSANLQKADLSGSDLTDCNLRRPICSSTGRFEVDGAMGMKIRLEIVRGADPRASISRGEICLNPRLPHPSPRTVDTLGRV